MRVTSGSFFHLRRVVMIDRQFAIAADTPEISTFIVRTTAQFLESVRSKYYSWALETTDAW